MMLGSKGILESNCINCLQIVQIIPFENIKKVLFLIGFQMIIVCKLKTINTISVSQTF